MKRIKLSTKSELKLTNFEGFLKRKVLPVGNGAKVNCPKEYLGKEVYLVVVKK